MKAWWGKLTDDDLERVEGNIHELAGMLQGRYGFERKEAEREIERHFP